MYDSVEELRKLQFELHAVMVHEGSIDSGHYWAYVRDHARKVNPAVRAHFIRAGSERQIQSNFLPFENVGILNVIRTALDHSKFKRFRYSSPHCIVEI